MTENANAAEIPSKGVRYVINSSEGITIMMDQNNGRLVYKDILADKVIQRAINTLGNERASVGIIKLKGTFIISKTIKLDNNINLDLSEANLVLGGNINMFNLNGKKDITIIGGNFDGNKVKYNSEYWSGIVGQGTRVTIDGTVFHDFHGKGIYGSWLSNSTIKNVRSYNNDQDGIMLDSGLRRNTNENVRFMNCYSWSNGRKGFNIGIAKQISFVSCVSYNNKEDGWNIEGGTPGVDYYWYDINLIDCKSYGNGDCGYRIQMGGRRITLINCDSFGNGSGAFVRGRDDAWNIDGVTILGGNYYSNSRSGIRFSYGVQHVNVTGVSIFNNNQGEAGYNGIDFKNTSNLAHVVVSNVRAFDDQKIHKQMRGVDFGTSNLNGQNILVSNLTGNGNIIELFRGIITKAYIIQ